MKRFATINLRGILAATVIATAAMAVPGITAPLAADVTTPKVGIVNFKQCVEESKIGKAERENFDEMRRQMESALEEKESRLQDMARKFSDPDYIDGLSPEAEAKSKEEYGKLSQEMGQLQQQYYQMLNQANFKVVQKISDEVATAARKAATDKGLTLVLNEESSFYYADALDITTDVVAVMDHNFETGVIESSTKSLTK